MKYIILVELSSIIMGKNGCRYTMYMYMTFLVKNTHYIYCICMYVYSS